ncbi:hypothetical protein [Halobacterium zhouii]|uniref:hypothetical protein n=1 Tax=Halobacterium zhouii TaxID=2902624 RepID=UPI001E5D1271|nr:hypothetical protein [Halobacterium zhouii]
MSVLPSPGFGTCKLPGEDVFLATKVCHDSLAYEDVKAGIRKSRQRLGDPDFAPDW